jgi:hypothetical protein
MVCGPLSAFVGSVALFCAIVSADLKRTLVPGGRILRWLDEIGLVRAPDPNRYPEWCAVGIVPLSDGLGAEWLLIHAWWFAFVAMILAARAEWLGEDNLYPSVGFLCGALALSIDYPVAALGYLLAGGLAATLWRRRRDA